MNSKRIQAVNGGETLYRSDSYGWQKAYRDYDIAVDPETGGQYLSDNIVYYIVYGNTMMPAHHTDTFRFFADFRSALDDMRRWRIEAYEVFDN